MPELAASLDAQKEKGRAQAIQPPPEWTMFMVDLAD